MKFNLLNFLFKIDSASLNLKQLEKSVWSRETKTNSFGACLIILMTMNCILEISLKQGLHPLPHVAPRMMKSLVL